MNTLLIECFRIEEDSYGNDAHAANWIHHGRHCAAAGKEESLGALLHIMAGPRGIEPRLTGLESVVLPLNYRPYSATIADEEPVGKGVSRARMAYNERIAMGMRATLLSSSLVTLSALPFVASAAATDFFGPIVPQGGDCLCPNSAMNWGCVLKVFENVQNALVSLGVLAVIFFIAWAGFSLMTGGSNPGTRQKAVNRMLNAVVGLVLILGSWLIVDTVMKYLYDPTTAFSSKQFGPWNTILGGDPKSYCLAVNEHPGQLTNGTTVGEVITSVTNPGTANSSSGSSGPGGPIPGSFTYDNDGIKAQSGDASAALTTLLSCMAGKLPTGVGRISSISDHVIQNGSKTFQQCAVGGKSVGCAHAVGSCHYGGTKCVGRSFAVDFGDDQNAGVLTAAAKACGAPYTGFESTHLHVSVGTACGCN